MGRKWANIVAKKTAKDGATSNIYAKFGVEIYAAAKQGEPDVTEEEGNIVIYTESTDLHKGIAALKAAGINEFSTTELEMIAQSEVELSPEDLEIFAGLVDALEDDDDVQKVYHNVANL